MEKYEVANRLNTRTFDLIDWTAYKTATGAKSKMFQNLMTKHTSKFLGTNKMLHLWMQIEDSKCPCCDHEMECTTHVLTCRNVDRRTLIYNDVKSCNDWMTSVSICPALATAIQHFILEKDLASFRSSSPERDPPHWGSKADMVR
jgi:hypothetical protein